MMPRRGRAQTAYFFEKLPFNETDHDPIRMNTLPDTPAPVLWPGNKEEDPSLHPQFYDVSDVFELMQRNRRARHPLTQREPVHVDELHPILYPGADLERYLNTVKLLCERLKPGPEREALFNEARSDLDAYFKPDIGSHDRQEKIIERLRGEFEHMPLRVFKRERDDSSSDEELVIDQEDQDILEMRTNFIQMQSHSREECNRSGEDPRVYVWRRDAWLLEQPSIFDICNPEILWAIRSNFERSMGDTYELRVQPYAYANGYANYERDYQQANLLADRFATLRVILYPTGINDWNMPFLQDKTIEVFKNLYADLSRRNVNLSTSLHMSERNEIPSPETIRHILNERFFTNLSGSLIRDGGPRYYIVNPLSPFQLVNEVTNRLNLANRNMLRERWRTSEEVAAILLTIAQRVIPAFVTMTPRQISDDINEEELFEFNASTNKYMLKSEERLRQQRVRFSDFEGRHLLDMIKNQEEMRDEFGMSLVLQVYLQHLRNR